MRNKRGTLEIPQKLIEVAAATVIFVIFLMVFISNAGGVDLIATVHSDVQLRTYKMLDTFVNNPNCLGGSVDDYHPGKLKQSDLVSAQSWTETSACMYHPGELADNYLGWAVYVYELPIVTDNIGTDENPNYAVTSNYYAVPSTIEDSWAKPLSENQHAVDSATMSWIAMTAAEKMVTIDKGGTPVPGKAVLKLYQLTEVTSP